MSPESKVKNLMHSEAAYYNLVISSILKTILQLDFYIDKIERPRGKSTAMLRTKLMLSQIHNRLDHITSERNHFNFSFSKGFLTM